METTNQTMAPPLDLDLNSVDTSMPLLAKGIYDLRIDKVQAKNSTAGLPMLAIDMVTLAPSKSVKNEDLSIGIHVFHNVMLAPSGKATWDMIQRNVAAITQSAGVAAKWGDVVGNPVGVFQGQTVKASVDVEPEGVDKNGKSYRAKNVVLVFMKAN